MLRQTLCRLIALWPCLGLALAVVGCRSVSEPASASFASVTIQNRTADEIVTVTTKVFGADGYRGGPRGAGAMVFEKEASKLTTLSREGLTGTYYGGQTIKRVRVEIVDLSGGAHRLQCKAFMITGGSDPFFQDEVPVTNIRSGPYQKLLNKVAKELK